MKAELRIKTGGGRRGIRVMAAGSVLVAGLLGGWLQGADWPHWRGPNHDGSTEATGLPATWSKTENVVWTLDMAGRSAATPIISGDHVFLSTIDASKDELLAMAVDRKTGKELWRASMGQGVSRDDRSNYASSSPVTDGKRVIFFYGNGRTAAFDFSGKRLWARDLTEDYGPFAFLWTFSSSPLLHGGRLYYQVLQRDVPARGRARSSDPIESYILAVDPQTGKTLWRQTRRSDAVAESRESFASPVPFRFGEREELLVAGGDCLTGHDPVTGRELWRWGTWNPTRIGHWRLVPSPVAGQGVILACGPKQAPIYAVKAGGAGELTDDALAWVTYDHRDLTSDVPTPLFYQGDFFVLSDLRRSLARVDPRTGEPKWSIATPGRAKYEASPTGADGRLFLMNFAGDVVVVDAATGDILQQIPMGEPGDDYTRSTIAVAHGHLFIRTNSRLYCIGNGSN